MILCQQIEQHKKNLGNILNDLQHLGASCRLQFTNQSIKTTSLSNYDGFKSFRFL